MIDVRVRWKCEGPKEAMTFWVLQMWKGSLMLIQYDMGTDPHPFTWMQEIVERMVAGMTEDERWQWRVIVFGFDHYVQSIPGVVMK